MRFRTDLLYNDRQEKAWYVWQKYGEVLQTSVLDVGADQQYLAGYLPSTASYWGIGLGGTPDQEVDLEEGELPFADNSYDTVLCLDVLEHLDNIYQIFDELCRVSRRYIIISLPNAWAGILHVIMFGDYQPHHHMKFYGLPLEKPEDRHKWFLSASEARHFIECRAVQNGWRVMQVDDYCSIDFRRWQNRLFRLCLRGLLAFSKVNADIFFTRTVWALLEKDSDLSGNMKSPQDVGSS